MQKSKAMAIKSLGLVAVFATMSSFSGTWGGDSYRIYVNNKLVLEQFVYNQKSVKSIQLNHNAVNDQVTVYYSHCGKTGTARHLDIRNASNKVLKEWKFSDASRKEDGMNCKAKDILALQKNGEKLNMYYSSKEMPSGKMLAQVLLTKDNTTMP
jgi:hypothetical protein